MLWRPDLYEFPVQFDGARIRVFHTCYDFNKGGLSGPILTDQGMDLASLQEEIYIFQGIDARKRFGNIPHG